MKGKEPIQIPDGYADIFLKTNEAAYATGVGPTKMQELMDEKRLGFRLPGGRDRRVSAAGLLVFLIDSELPLGKFRFLMQKVLKRESQSQFRIPDLSDKTPDDALSMGQVGPLFGVKEVTPRKWIDANLLPEDFPLNGIIGRHVKIRDLLAFALQHGLPTRRLEEVCKPKKENLVA